MMHRACIRKNLEEEDDYTALVAAQSDALADLSREIAETITALEGETSKD
jgi:hypothetical protein